MYSINFTATRKKFCLSLHYNEDNSYSFVNDTEITKFKANNSEIVPNHHQLLIISRFFYKGFHKRNNHHYLFHLVLAKFF